MNTTKPTRTTPRDMAEIPLRYCEDGRRFCRPASDAARHGPDPCSLLFRSENCHSRRSRSVALTQRPRPARQSCCRKRKRTKSILRWTFSSSHEVLHRVVYAVVRKSEYSEIRNYRILAASEIDRQRLPPPKAQRTGPESILSGLRLSEVSSDSDLAIRRLQTAGSRIPAPKQSTIITIGYTPASPDRRMSSTYYYVFLEEHLRHTFLFRVLLPAMILSLLC